MIAGLIRIAGCGFAVAAFTASWQSSEAGSPKSGQTVDLRFPRPLDTAGVAHRLAMAPEQVGSVFVFLSPECPIACQYLPELNRLSAALPRERVAFYGVVSDRSSRGAASEFAKAYEAKFPILFDGSGELATLFAPTHVPEAFVVDAKGTVTYRGRIDDVFAALDKRRQEPTRRDLLEAMTALERGESAPVARTEVVGCLFENAASASKSGKVTFNRDIAPIVYANCAECHRPKQVAPFSLLSYEDVSKRAKFLKEVTKSGLMPPWRAEVGYGHFLDERRLTDRQVELLSAWADAGAPEGDPADATPVPSFPEGWRLGEPDYVAEAPVPFEVPADGPDIFQHFVIPVTLPEDKTLIGFEFKPGNPAVVHHAVIFLDSTGGARAKDAETPEPGFRTSGSVDSSVTAMVGVWTPGMTPRLYTKGIGVRMDKEVDIVLQLHLHPSGKVETDQSSIALYFSDQPAQEMQRQGMLLMGSLAIDIPPGADRHRIGATLKLPVDVTLLSVFPHLHLIGKEMKVTATLPDGEIRPLIWIKDWNFYWQDSYSYHEPVHLPKGSKIELTAAYDNSATNVLNPSSPPKRVLFGNGSTDEMCFAFFQIVGQDRQMMARMGPALMESFLSQWREANIDDEARDKIIDEAGKLFGRRGGEMLRSLLLLQPKSSKKPMARVVAPPISPQVSGD